MAIDFDALVLGPCMDAFAEDITVDARASRPGEPPYAARGSYHERAVDVALTDGAILSSAEKTLGVRLSEFVVPPAQGDLMILRGATFVVEDLDEDGQGGARLTLKELRE